MTAQEYRERPQRRDSTRALRVTPKNLADAAAFLMLDEDQTDTFVRCLRDEPLKRLLGIVDWLLAHEQDEDYDPSSMVVMWAKKRGAGCFRRPEPTAAERTHSGSSDEPHREMQEALETGDRSRPAGKWGRLSSEQVEKNLDRMERS